MTKQDGQVWLCLYNLLLRDDCQKKYDFNNFNKNQLLKVHCSSCHYLRSSFGGPLHGCSSLGSLQLRGFLTEVLLDQLPNLLQLQMFLSQLALCEPASPRKELVLEQVDHGFSLL